MKEKEIVQGHISALITVLVWGATFISTKILLVQFKPIEILFYRFSIGLFILWIIYPKKLRLADKKQELLFAAAGLTGIMLYYLLENIALVYTSASNVGIIISVAPFFTAIFATVFLDGEKPKINFYIGFCLSMIGIYIISLNGNNDLTLNPIGDLLALLSAIVWAIYSILSKKISSLGYTVIQSTRKTFLYGLIFMIPTLPFLHFELGMERFIQPVYLANILFLGLGASALCFVTWNIAVKRLGAVKTSIYIYMVPVITVIISFIVLHEKITWISVVGIILILTGLLMSERRLKK